eukprot:scaffold57061_cov31-Tisochrysis_lutea.AAC.2
MPTFAAAAPLSRPKSRPAAPKSMPAPATVAPPKSKSSLAPRVTQSKSAGSVREREPNASYSTLNTRKAGRSRSDGHGDPSLLWRATRNALSIPLLIVTIAMDMLVAATLNAPMRRWVGARELCAMTASQLFGGNCVTCRTLVYVPSSGCGAPAGNALQLVRCISLHIPRHPPCPHGRHVCMAANTHRYILTRGVRRDGFLGRDAERDDTAHCVARP